MGACVLYLVLDGMVSGTGVRDAFEGGYLSLSSLGISANLQERISTWLSEYQALHFTSFSNADEVARLDEEGVAMGRQILAELPGSKVEYFSAAKMIKIPIPKPMT